MPSDHEAARRHAAYYAEALSIADSLFVRGGENIDRALFLFDSEWDNIRKGQAWATAESQRDDEAARLCSEYALEGAYLLNLRQPPRANTEWIESALDAARRLGDQTPQAAHLERIPNGIKG